MTSTEPLQHCKVMQRKRYTDDQKAEALHLLAEVGLGESARRTGIPPGTVASWGHRNGVESPPTDTVAALVEQRKESWQIRKIALGERLGRICEKAAQRIEERLDADTIHGIRDLSGSIAILVDRAQLLTGGATSRTETVERTPEAEAEVAQVLEQVRRAA